MRKEVERILRWEDLDKKHKQFRAVAIKACKYLSTLQTRCKHEVLIVTQTGNVPQSIQNTKCLFCGRENINLGYLDFNTKVIHSVNSKLWLSHPSKYEVAKKIFIKLAIENPNMGIEQIANMVNTKIDSESKIFIEATEEVYSESKKSP